jgi:hypothetical protein
MEPAKLSYKIYQGSTFTETLRWESETKAYMAISNISQSAPCVITTVATHSVPVNWRVRVTGVNGMKDINTIAEDDYYLVTSKTTNSVTLNQENSAAYAAYTSGGILSWNMPVPLTGYTALMQIRETLESETVIAELSTSNGRIAIDALNYTISISLPASLTSTFDFDSAVYSMELTDNQGNVFQFLNGSISLVKEVTR